MLSYSEVSLTVQSDSFFVLNKASTWENKGTGGWGSLYHLHPNKQSLLIRDSLVPRLVFGFHGRSIRRILWTADRSGQLQERNLKSEWVERSMKKIFTSGEKPITHAIKGWHLPATAIQLILIIEDFFINRTGRHRLAFRQRLAELELFVNCWQPKTLGNGRVLQRRC